MSEKTESPRILGYVMARNEWPLLEIALAHVLRAGVDHVVVLDHGSDDGTQSGLNLMQADFPGRITINRVERGPFLQEAATALAAVQFGSQSFDWFYVFDADEFLIVKPGTTLKQVLGGIPSNYDAVRYQIDQWVAPRKMNENEVEEYTRVHFRAVAGLALELPGEVAADEIIHGNLNFFDIPFQSKVIVRMPFGHILAAGAHFLNGFGNHSELSLEAGLVSCAHLPFRGTRALQRRVEQGSSLAQEGFPKEIGWQSQMLSQMGRDFGLYEFWKKHSVDEEKQDLIDTHGSPTLVADKRLSALIHAALKFRKTPAVSGHTAQPPGGPLTWEIAVKALQAQISEKYLATSTRDATTPSRVEGQSRRLVTSLRRARDFFVLMASANKTSRFQPRQPSRRKPQL